MISAPTENERTVTEMAEYIEREKLISDIDATMENAGVGYVVGQTMKRYVKRVAAADVAPVRHGNWCWEGRFRACSVCGSYVEFTETLGASHWKYCPYCGAKNDGDASQKMNR